MSTVNTPRYSIWTATAGDALGKEVARTLARHDVVENARRDARLNLPPVNATELSQVEAELVQERAANLHAVEEAMHKQINEHLTQQRALLDERLDAPQRALIALPRLAGIERDNLLEEERAHLTTDKVAACQAQRNLNAFWRANPLTAHRAAKLVSGPDKMLAYSIMALITFLEAVVNALFWDDFSARGWAGGMGQALLLAAGNVGAAFLAGFLVFQTLEHARISIRTFGWLFLLVWLAWLGTYNIWLGHYRIAAETGEDKFAALQTLLADPVALLFTNGDALILTVTGLLAAVLVAYKSFHLDDRYLGYSEVAREQQQAQDAFDSRVRNLRTTLADNLKARLAEISNLQATVTKGKQALDGLARKVHQLCEETRNSQKFQQSALDAVVGAYRDEQGAIRTSVPQYFAAGLPRLSLMDCAALEFQASRAAEDMSRFVDTFAKDAAAAANALTEDTEAALRNLQAYLDSIAEAAATQINDQSVDYYQSLPMGKTPSTRDLRTAA